MGKNQLCRISLPIKCTMKQVRVISQLRSQIQGLIDNRNSQMTQAHDRMMQEIGARDMKISQLTNENSQLVAMVEQMKGTLERMSNDHQFQTNRLEKSVVQARVR